MFVNCAEMGFLHRRSEAKTNDVDRDVHDAPSGRSSTTSTVQHQHHSSSGALSCHSGLEKYMTMSLSFKIKIYGIPLFTTTFTLEIGMHTYVHGATTTGER
mmetsp:Transcript_4750/g.11663  ORF Transcript_4750/g.11663 Transcript_4750/m.11663 type:complete len:101 (+) Transcript_4750:454-756(+)